MATAIAVGVGVAAAAFLVCTCLPEICDSESDEHIIRVAPVW